MALGVRFRDFVPDENPGEKGFEQLLNLFMQLINITSGDVGEALQWLNELDKQYGLTDNDYGMGNFIEDLKKEFFEEMMRKKIVMPAHYMREMGVDMGKTFGHFTDAAQRLGVYTSNDYTEILDTLISEWKIAYRTGLTPAAEKGRDYLMALPNRLRRVSDRMAVPKLEYQFKWIS